MSIDPTVPEVGLTVNTIPVGIVKTAVAVWGVESAPVNVCIPGAVDTGIVYVQLKLPVPYVYPLQADTLPDIQVT
ncbi:MAG: hypothetical protein WBG19_06590 [Thermoplasmata archaeon]